MKIEIAGVQDVDGVWPLVGPKFHAAAERFGDEIGAGELWQICRSGNAFLVIAYEEKNILMQCVVRFEKWNGKPVLRVMTLAGTNMKTWLSALLEFLGDLGKANGASLLLTEGREGWGRVIPKGRKLRSLFVMEID